MPTGIVRDGKAEHREILGVGFQHEAEGAAEDVAAGRATGKSVAAKEINSRLDEIRARVLGIYAELSAVRDGVRAEEVKHRLLGMASEQETLLAYS